MVSRKTLKKNDLENFKPLYTNKKVQLQLDFLISPAVAGIFFISNKKVQLQLDFLISNKKSSNSWTF